MDGGKTGILYVAHNKMREPVPFLLEQLYMKAK